MPGIPAKVDVLKSAQMFIFGFLDLCAFFVTSRIFSLGV